MYIDVPPGEFSCSVILLLRHAASASLLSASTICSAPNLDLPFAQPFCFVQTFSVFISTSSLVESMDDLSRESGCLRNQEKHMREQIPCLPRLSTSSEALLPFSPSDCQRCSSVGHVMLKGNEYSLRGQCEQQLMSTVEMKSAEAASNKE